MLIILVFSFFEAGFLVSGQNITDLVLKISIETLRRRRLRLENGVAGQRRKSSLLMGGLVQVDSRIVDVLVVVLEGCLTVLFL